ncbi:MAG: hypothetical protein JST04_06945 [Bdellovibrionales bacterium]|nr:hypothetical protein [Bdellovibrionales bacterium]
MNTTFKRGALAAGLVTAIGFSAGCLQNTGVVSKDGLLSTSSQSQTQPADDGNFQVVPAGSAFSVTGAQNAAINLGASSDQSYSLHTGSYSGSLKVTIEYDEIQDVDKKSQISFVASPSVFSVSPNQNYAFKVTSAATTAAPDVALHYHVVVREASGAVRKETQMETEFAVNPVYEIVINQGDAKNAVLWSTDLVNAGTGVAAKQPQSFINHAAGITIRFINMDPKGPHIIHGSGLIPHQNTSTRLRSLAAGAVNPAGQTYIDAYEAKITSKTANGSATYYLHDAESSAKGGKITFNIDQATVKPPVVDPTATFAKVNANVLQPKCVGCHSGGSPQGGIDLSSYAAVVKQTVIYDPASSGLYTSVLSNASPLMPLGGSMLSSTDQDLIKNWIINGTPNN